MLVAALPLKEHLQGLAKADTQGELPMNKAEKEGYIEIPIGYIVFASPWSNTVSFGGFAEEVVPVDIRHTGAGRDLPGWRLTSCCPSSSSCSWTSSCRFSTLTLSGGVRGAIPLPMAVGWGADGDTRHVLQNAHDLATYQADHPGPEESQPEFEGNSTQPFHDDERIAIYVGLRRILSDLWALCVPMSYQDQADLVAYQSVETTLESHHSVITDSSSSRHYPCQVGSAQCAEVVARARPDFEGLASGLSTAAYRHIKLDGQSQKEDRKSALNAALGGVWHEERAHSAFQ
eukprot:1066285-Amphidinium_carterae.1